MALVRRRWGGRRRCRGAPVNIIHSPSPNWSERPAGVVPTLIVWHATAGTDSSDLPWLTNPVSKVSAHYLVTRSGIIHRLVYPEKKAWHAGASSWKGRGNVNDFSIGVEITCLPTQDYTDAQYRAAGWLGMTLMRHFPIEWSGHVGHYSISPGRKTDPYYQFHWGRLFEEILRAKAAAGATFKAA